MTPDSLGGKRLLAVCAATEWGGNEKWFLRTCEGLAARGAEVNLVVRIPESYQAHTRGSSPRLRMRSLPFRGDADLYSLARLVAHCRKADIMLASKERGFLLGGLAGWITGVPVVLRHGVVRALRDKLSDRMRYGRLPAALIVNAEEIRDTLRRKQWMKDKPIHVMYNGVDAPGPGSKDRREELRTALGIGPGTTLIMGIGRLASDKRWNWLIDATADLSVHGLDVASVVFGQGKMQASFEARIVERDIGDRFQLAGFRPDIENWLDAADILAHPSELEGLPNVVLEAMGRGVAVLSTRAGGLGEIVTSGRQAILCDVVDYAGFVDGLESLVRDKDLRERVATAGLRHVRDHHSWERMLDRVEGILTAIIERRDADDV